MWGDIEYSLPPIESIGRRTLNLEHGILNVEVILRS